MSAQYPPNLKPIFNVSSYKHSSLIPFEEGLKFINLLLTEYFLFNSPSIAFYTNNIDTTNYLNTTELKIGKMNVNEMNFGNTNYTSTHYGTATQNTPHGVKQGIKMNSSALEDGLYFGNDGSVSPTIGDLNITRLLLKCDSNVILSNPTANLRITRNSIQFGGINAGEQTHSAYIASGVFRPDGLNIVGASTGGNGATRRLAFIARNVEIRDGGLRPNSLIAPPFSSLFNWGTHFYNKSPRINISGLTTTPTNYTVPFPTGYIWNANDIFDLQIQDPITIRGTIWYHNTTVADITAGNLTFTIWASQTNATPITICVHIIRRTL